MNKNKKRMAKGIAAAALIGVIAVGSTLAYLSATTGTKTNKFTGSDKTITGETTETYYDINKAGSYVPGDLIKKNPTVKLTASSESAYVALSTDYYGDDVTFNPEGSTNVSDGTKMSRTAFAKYATINDLNAKPDKEDGAWTLIAKSVNGSELYMYDTALEPNGTSDVSATELFTETTVNAGLRTITESEIKTTDVYTFTDINKNGRCDTQEEKATMKKVDSNVLESKTVSSNYIDGNGNTLAVTSLPPFVIDIKGFAVQSTNVELAEAKAELIKLANNGRTGNDVFTAE